MAFIQVFISTLQPDDIQYLEPILRQHVRDRDTGEIIEDEITEIKSFMLGELDGYGRTRKFVVAKSKNGQVFGCMALTSVDPDLSKHLSGVDANTAGELVNAFVDSSVFRGNGIGRQLFDVICQLAKDQNKKYLVLSSGPRYKASWGFYDHVCDQNKGFIIGKFGPGGDANTWLKKL